MSLTLPVNRRLAACVALMFVFFSTFGALTHNHATSESAGASQATHHSQQTGFTVEAVGSVPAHCPICDWQSLAVTTPPASAQVLPPSLLSIAPSIAIFGLHSLPAFRSSSRGPPLA